MELSFKKYLEEQEKLAPRKGDRTRIRLRIATIDVLDRVGYHRMRISDITAAAGVTAGSLYQYYSDKLHVTLAVLDEFGEFFAKCQNIGYDGPARSHFEAIRRSNFRFFRLVEQNPGLMRCLLQVADDEPEFARRFYANSHRQNQRIAQGILKRLGASPDRLPTITVVVYALGAMMDEIARRLLVQKDPELRGLVDAIDLDTEALADVLASIWYRTLYAGDSAESKDAIACALGAPRQVVPQARVQPQPGRRRPRAIRPAR